MVADTAVVETDELREMIAAGQERGVLTSQAIAAPLGDVELSREQVQDLFSYLDEHGIEVVDPGDGGHGSGSAETDRDDDDSVQQEDALADGAESPVPASAGEGEEEDTQD